MRALALLLILANVCFFFWAHYIDVPEALPLTATPPDSKRPPLLMLAKEQPGAQSAASSASSLASELTCISVGPFDADHDLQKITQRLRDAGFSATPRTVQGEVFVGYWVNLSGLATRADAEQTLKRLHAADITDAYILPEENPPLLSLGLFTEQTRAEQRRDAIAKLGFQPQIQNRTRKGEVHWLDVSLQEPGQLIDPILLQPESGGIVRLETTACPTSEQSSSQSFASSAASSTKATSTKTAAR